MFEKNGGERRAILFFVPKEHKIYLLEVQWYINNLRGLIDINKALASVLGTLHPLSLFL